MKGAHLHRLRSYQSRHAAAHLVGGFVGERQSHNLVRGDAAGDEVGDPVSDHPGLATARPREHQERAFDVRGRQPLRLVEGVEVHGAGSN